MKYLLTSLLGVGAVSAQNPVGVWEQCGGYGYKGPWQCKPGFTCSPAPYGSPGNLGTTFPEYLCTPSPGTVAPPYVYYVPQYAQCGGQGFSGPTDCLPPYICTVDNQYFSQCLVDPNNPTPPPPAPPTPTNPTPNLADPGSYCGDLAVAFSAPTECVPGFSCQIVPTADIYYVYMVCLINTSSSSSVVTTTTNPTSSATLSKKTTTSLTTTTLSKKTTSLPTTTLSKKTKPSTTTYKL